MEAAPSAVEAEPEPAAATGLEARREAYMRRPVDPALLTTTKCKGPPARRNVPAKTNSREKPRPKVRFPTFQCLCTHARNTCANTDLPGRCRRRLFRYPWRSLARPPPPRDLLDAPAPSQASDRYALIVYHKKSLLCNNLKILKFWN